MGVEPYRTVADEGTARVRARGSRFIGRVTNVSSVEAAEGRVDEVSTEHSDATHVVVAYRIREDPLREYHDDAGEPSGSAGPPALNVLQGEGLENVVAIVVRYYGGTNLGVGGLVKAYSTAVKRALDATTIVAVEPRRRLVIRSAYDDSGTVRSILDASEATFEARYETDVSFKVSVPHSDESALRDRLLSATRGRVAIEEAPR